MKKHPLFAVVDIETTGTNSGKDRIIQFGCVLIEDGKIVSQFATDINPRIKIPKLIEDLTGIRMAQVAKAPYFEDVAFTIYQLLSDCTFVAHNVTFDYQFLNQELQRCGVKELTIPAIDTVELAQTFLPDSPSFRLSDLGQQMHFVHDRPHQADSDAYVTAELFLAIEKKMRKLPLITMEKIAAFAHAYSMDTGSYIEEIYQQMRNNPPELAENLHIIAGLALKKKKVALFSDHQYEETTYPVTDLEKKELFGEKLSYRLEQAQMMDKVYRHFASGTNKNLAIQAATGLGKTMGYLFPLSYLVTPELPLIVSTPSIVLQNQLLAESIPNLNQLLKRKSKAVSVKGLHHYLDLASFAASLKKSAHQKQYILYQMRVLVWLTETVTGDMDELNLTNYQHQFWVDVRCHSGFNVSKDSPYFQVDFIQHLLEKVKQANIIIVNHAFLNQEEQRVEKFLPEKFFAVIDEAEHLPAIAQTMSTADFSLFKFRQLVKHINQDEELIRLFMTAMDQLFLQKQFKLLTKILDELEMNYEHFYSELKQELKIKNGTTEYPITNEIIHHLKIGAPNLGKNIAVHLKDCLTILLLLEKEVKKEWSKWLRIEQESFKKFFQLIEKVKEQKEFFASIFNEEQEAIVKWFTLGNERHKFSDKLSICNLNYCQIEEHSWYQKSEKILYTGGTLSSDDKGAYLKRELGLTQLDYVQLPDPYDYRKQAMLLVPSDNQVNLYSSKEYGQYVVQILKELISSQEQSIMVLFTSHELLIEVYRMLHYTMLNQQKTLLAQGVSGGKEKIFKKFLSNKGSILLGTDSFWVGVDLPGDHLEILVITKLPFDPPGRPLIQAKYHFLEEKGIHPFYHEALPKAIMRLRQGLGRLIRSTTDRGIMLVLDDRLIKASYSHTIQKALPPSLKPDYMPISQVLETINLFFKND